MTTYIEDTWTRIEEANITAGWPSDWTVAERDQMEALADQLNRELLSVHSSRDCKPTAPVRFDWGEPCDLTWLTFRGFR